MWPEPSNQLGRHFSSPVVIVAVLAGILGPVDGLVLRLDVRPGNRIPVHAAHLGLHQLAGPASLTSPPGPPPNTSPGSSARPAYPALPDCTIEDLRTFANQMRTQRGWGIATSGGWGSSTREGHDTTYSLRARRKSLS